MSKESKLRYSYHVMTEEIQQSYSTHPMVEKVHKNTLLMPCEKKKTYSHAMTEEIKQG